MQAYEGTELPTDQIAIIKSDYSNIFNMAYPRSIDGIELEAHQDRISVLPGEHRLVIFVISERGLVTYSSKSALLLNAKAGHTYLVGGKIVSGEETWAWIVDKESGLVVAGEKPD
jgi:hypothetical protein